MKYKLLLNTITRNHEIYKEKKLKLSKQLHRWALFHNQSNKHEILINKTATTTIIQLVEQVAKFVYSFDFGGKLYEFGDTNFMRMLKAACRTKLVGYRSMVLRFSSNTFEQSPNKQNKIQHRAISIFPVNLTNAGMNKCASTALAKQTKEIRSNTPHKQHMVSSWFNRTMIKSASTSSRYHKK